MGGEWRSGRRRREEFEPAEALDRDAQGDETEAGAEPGEEGAFGGEMVARSGAGVLEGAEAGEHWGLNVRREGVRRRRVE